MATVNKYDLVTIGTTSSEGDGSSEYYFNMQNYSFFTLQIEDVAGVAGSNSYKLSGSVYGTAYQDFTSAVFGVSSVTGDNLFIADTPCHFRTVKVDVTRTGDSANTDGGWTIAVKRSA